MVCVAETLTSESLKRSLAFVIDAAFAVETKPLTATKETMAMKATIFLNFCMGMIFLLFNKRVLFSVFALVRITFTGFFDLNPIGPGANATNVKINYSDFGELGMKI